MRSGDSYVGPDGTIYLVVRAASVAEDQLRWWVDRREARMRAQDLLGPDTPADLHLIPRCDCGAMAFALVLP